MSIFILFLTIVGHYGIYICYGITACIYRSVCDGIVMNEVKTTFRIDHDIIRRYKIAAANKDTSMSELIRKVLEKGIKELEK